MRDSEIRNLGPASRSSLQSRHVLEEGRRRESRDFGARRSATRACGTAETSRKFDGTETRRQLPRWKWIRTRRTETGSGGAMSRVMTRAAEIIPDVLTESCATEADYQNRPRVSSTQYSPGKCENASFSLAPPPVYLFLSLSLSAAAVERNWILIDRPRRTWPPDRFDPSR